MTSELAPESRMGALLRDLYWLFRNAVDQRLQPLGLSSAQWRPLLMLHQRGDAMTQTELAGYLDIEAPTLVRLLDRLSEKGWIERRACEEDRRVRRVLLTPRARAVCAEIDAAVLAVQAQALEGIAPDDIEQCIGVLERIRRRLQSAD